jgi:hypothetical protein
VSHLRITKHFGSARRNARLLRFLTNVAIELLDQFHMVLFVTDKWKEITVRPTLNINNEA